MYSFKPPLHCMVTKLATSLVSTESLGSGDEATTTCIAIGSTVVIINAYPVGAEEGGDEAQKQHWYVQTEAGEKCDCHHKLETIRRWCGKGDTSPVLEDRQTDKT